MLITSRDRLEPRAGEHAHTLKICLPAARKPGQDDVLAEHIDSFVRLFLSRFDGRTLRASRIGPLRWAVVSNAHSMMTLEQLRAELETALFGSTQDAEAGQITLIGQTVEEDEGEYVPATAGTDTPDLAGEEDGWTVDEPLVASEAGPDADSLPASLREELDAFRADMRAIAESMKGPSLQGTLDGFRSGLDALAERMETCLGEAADKVDSAAERIDTATLRLPDPDRLELALTRNDASAALITNGLQESLKLLLKAVEGLERHGGAASAPPASHREAA